MAQTADLRPEVRTTQSWEDKMFLAQWPFNKDTVLDYFYNSIFFDRRSTNAQLKMQQPELPPAAAAAALEKIDGITYELARHEEIPPTDGAPPRRRGHRTPLVLRARRRGVRGALVAGRAERARPAPRLAPLEGLRGPERGPQGEGGDVEAGVARDVASDEPRLESVPRLERRDVA